MTEEPRASTVRVGSRALIVDPDHRVLLAEHTTSDGIVWVAPGGGVESGESPTDALARELMEEAGLRVNPGSHPVPLWIQSHDPGIFDGRSVENHYFLLGSDALEHIPYPLPTAFPLDPGLLSMRWWSVAELREASERGVLFSPRSFVDLWPGVLDDLQHRRVADAPIRIGA